ncbi:FecR domain-containing protein [Bremerella sp. T1]|uniref:FecR domain-containing protein n=1 Tax=Bremerella sp. TYQ1 TaxID=3119568 RepID=UPI001CC8FC48|nr:FecR domain-containing protein [Bremerella volcania]UBM36728.1 FecR domain-containing protein [Bremerella volcania]
MSSQQEQELLKLLDRLLDDQLDEQGNQRLAELLESPDAQQIYKQYMWLHADLFQAAGHDIDSLELPAKPGPHRLRARSSGWILGLALSLTIVFAGLWGASLWAPARPQESLGEITHSEDARWQSEGQPQDELGQIHRGNWELTSGSATIVMNSGAEVSLRGPSKFQVLDAKAIQLDFGDVTIHAPDSAVGFRVLTPTGDIVDLGTEFNVSVDNSGETEVHVSQGVVVAKSVSNGSVVPILRGEAGRIDRTLGDIMPTPFDLARFGKEEKPQEAPGQRTSLGKFAPIPGDARIVFLGDSATDQETYILLIKQYLKQVGTHADVRYFNSGMTFQFFFDEANFQQHVAAFAPTHAVLEFGTELAINSVDPGTFEQQLRQLCSRLEATSIEPVLVIDYPFSAGSAEIRTRQQVYRQIVMGVAREFGYRIADAEYHFLSSPIQQDHLVSSDGRRPSFDGHRLLAKAILESLGYSDGDIDRTIEISMLPGVIQDWKYKTKEDDQPLTAQVVRALQTDVSWKEISLPLPENTFAKRIADESHLVGYRDRSRGYATSLPANYRPGIVAVSQIECEAPKTAYVNVGASVHAVWVNGEQVLRLSEWTGWHAGKKRVAVALAAGKNQIVIEAGDNFFVSVTDDRDWSL